MKSSETKKTKSDVLKEFRANLDLYTPEYQRKGLAILEGLLPDLQAEYEGKQPPKEMDIETMVTNLSETDRGYEALSILVRHLVEKLAYHKPVFQKEIVAILLDQMPAIEKEHEEDLAREALIDEILNDVIRFMSTSQLVLLVKQIKKERPADY